MSDTNHTRSHEAIGTAKDWTEGMTTEQLRAQVHEWHHAHDSQREMNEELHERLQALQSRLSSALKYVDYIAKRYEEGWDEPITERFYNEAKTLLGGVVERQSANPADHPRIAGYAEDFDDRSE